MPNVSRVYQLRGFDIVLTHVCVLVASTMIILFDHCESWARLSRLIRMLRVGGLCEVLTLDQEVSVLTTVWQLKTIADAS